MRFLIVLSCFLLTSCIMYHPRTAPRDYQAAYYPPHNLGNPYATYEGTKKTQPPAYIILDNNINYYEGQGWKHHQPYVCITRNERTMCK